MKIAARISHSWHKLTTHPYLFWALAWGTGWASLIHLNTANLYRIEGDWQEQLLRWRPPQTPAPEVAIIGINGRVGNTPGSADFLLDRANYASLALRLLEDGQASVVVLNLPSSFVVPQTLGNEDLDAPLRQVVQRYGSRMVLATQSSESFQQAEISIYNHFLPVSSLSLSYLVEPTEVQGIVQYSLDPLGVLRHAYFWGTFKRRDSQKAEDFAFLEFLALAKLDPTKARQWAQENRQPFVFKPLRAQEAIPVIPIEEVCSPNTMNSCLQSPDTQRLNQFQGKVVFVGFVDGYSETLPVKIATGEQVPAVQVQAQILSSMLKTDRYHDLNPWIRLLVIQGSGWISGLVVIVRHQRLSPLWIVLFLMVGYEGWAGWQFLRAQVIWPFVTPLWSSGLTAISVLLTMTLIHTQERLRAQQIELEKLKQAEQEAAVDQARKLLYRVATDIHDRELQELKLVMDALEALQWQKDPPSASIYDPLLEQMESIGRGIREQLNNVRTLADKLHISPALREGLHKGIEDYLHHLIHNRILTLSVHQELHPLVESNSSDWLDAREDIMRFVREALANVICHVQPPKGTATYVRVSLQQQGSRCRLEISNDGIEYAPGSRKGGYGTKAMNTIARDLPHGSWQRIHTPSGITQVNLEWTMPPKS
jgi:signal transduction histidine kinase